MTMMIVVEFILSMRTFAHAHNDVVFITSFSLEEDYRVTTRVFIIEVIQLPWFILYSPRRNPTIVIPLSSRESRKQEKAIGNP